MPTYQKKSGFNGSSSSAEQYVESQVHIGLGGGQFMTVTGICKWTDFKYLENGSQKFSFMISCPGGVSVKTDKGYEWPWSSHWITILSNEKSQEAKGKDTKPDGKGTNCEQFAETILTGVPITITYRPSLDPDGGAQITYKDMKEGNKEYKEVSAAFTCFGAQNILDIQFPGSKEDREAMHEAYEARKEARGNNRTVTQSEPEPSKSTAWTKPASKPVEPLFGAQAPFEADPAPAPEPKRIAWGSRK